VSSKFEQGRWREGNGGRPRTEEAYWQWIKRFRVFHREEAEILKVESGRLKETSII